MKGNASSVAVGLVWRAPTVGSMTESIRPSFFGYKDKTVLCVPIIKYGLKS